MRRLKIMPEDYEPPKNPFGMDTLYDAYEVYVKGHIDMGPFANLMERVEYIGREIVYKYYRV